MGGRKYRKTVYAAAAALIMSTCTMPVMAAPYANNDKTLTAVNTDKTYAQGADTEAKIITSVPINTAVNVIQAGETWHKVKVGELTGYMSSAATALHETRSSVS